MLRNWWGLASVISIATRYGLDVGGFEDEYWGRGINH